MNISDNQFKGFTLVELIVVITILTILGTIAFISLQGYSKDARDSVRASDISSLETSLELSMISSGKYTLPDDYLTITASGIDIRYQGTAGKQVMVNTNISGDMTDPKTKDYHSYITNAKRNKYQIIGNFENDISYNSFLNLSYADSNTYKKMFGSNLGLITSNSIPLNNTNTGVLDIRNTNQEYSIYFKNNDVFTSSSGAELFTNIYNRDYNLLQNKDLATLDENLLLYFDMESVNSNSRLIDLSKNGSEGFCKHNFGGIYSDVDFQVVGCGTNGGVAMSSNGVVFDGIGDVIEVTDFGLGSYDWSIEFMGIIEELGDDTYIDYKGVQTALHKWGRYVLAHPRSAGADQRFDFNIEKKEIGLKLAEAAEIGERSQYSNYDIEENNNSFYHVVAQRTNEKILFYINGKLIGETEDIQTNHPWDLNWLIGSRITGQMPFKGTMRSFRVFDRVLSAEEIEGMYSSIINKK